MSLGRRLLPAILCATSVAACSAPTTRGYEYMPDMVYSVAYDSFAPNPNTRDGLTLQRPVKGTIPRGFMPIHYAATEAEAERAGRELQNPVVPTARTAV